MRDRGITAQAPPAEQAKTRVPESDRQRELHELYERFGKPLEGEHWGEYVAVSLDGETLLGTDLLDLVQRARDAFGPGNTVFKVGEIAVGNAP